RVLPYPSRPFVQVFTKSRGRTAALLKMASRKSHGQLYNQSNGDSQAPKGKGVIMMKKLLTAIAFTVLAAVALASFMGAFGSGTIQVGSNTGVFGLSVRQGDNHTFGSAGYAELTPSHTVASY